MAVCGVQDIVAERERQLPMPLGSCIYQPGHPRYLEALHQLNIARVGKQARLGGLTVVSRRAALRTLTCCRRAATVLLPPV